MPEQLSGSTRRSDISVESTNSVDYSSLNPLRERLVDPDSIDRNAFGALPAGLQDIELAGVSQQVGPLFHNRLSVYPKKEKALRRMYSLFAFDGPAAAHCYFIRCRSASASRHSSGGPFQRWLIFDLDQYLDGMLDHYAK
jgi:hypothetical protein